MTDLPVWAQIIGTIGFPAAAFLLAGWYIVTKDKQHTEEMKQIREDHKQEISGLRKSFDKLAEAVRELLEEWRKV